MFVHLHNHSDYSFRDSIAKVKNSLERVKELGMTAYAITDHANNMAWYTFSKYSKEIGIKPIFGVEMYEVNDVNIKEGKRGKQSVYHLVFLAKNKQGIIALNKMITYAYQQFYYVPRIDMNYIEQHAQELYDNVIVLTGCIQGRLPQLLLQQKEDEAFNYVSDLITYLGYNNLFIELQNHGTEEEIKATKALYLFAKKYHLNIVATNDVHYINKEDYILREIMIARDRKQTLKQREQNNEIFPPELYIKSEEEMAQLFPQEALKNTELINNMIEEIDLEGKVWHFPKADFKETIEEICEREVKKKYPGREQEIMNIVNAELKVIDMIGAREYLLLCRDFIQYAKNNNIMVGIGRGSAVGSVICYLMGITEVEPLQYNLLFERFMNPERITMPDIDTDYEKDLRIKVIQYAQNKYGADKVAHIANVSKMGFKQAFKDVASVYGIDPQTANDITTKIDSTDPEEIKQEIQNKPELFQYYQQYTEIFERAFVLTGINRQKSVHASGILIADETLTNYVALDYNSDDGIPIALADMSDIEYLKLIKMDFLGLKTLSVIKDTLMLIKQRYNKEIDILNIPLDDAKVWQYISSGKTKMIFQLENEGMQNFMKQLKPKNLEELIAGLSLFRPGPIDMIPEYLQNRENPDNIQYPQDAEKFLKPILDVTYGCIVYQEQVMQIFRDLAGYSLGEADLVRRAMAKKKKEELEQHYEKFIQGCANNGISQQTAQWLWDKMEKFAKYAFNKSHAAAYATLSYITAYLKYYYKTEYITAYLNHLENNQKNEISEYVKHAEEEGVRILPPNINKSEEQFALKGNCIYFGLKYIKGCDKEVDKIMKERASKSFENYMDLIERCNLKKNTFKALCLVGALDEIIPNRKFIIENLDIIYKNRKLKRKKELKEVTEDFSVFTKFIDEYLLLGTTLTNLTPYRYKNPLNENQIIGFILKDNKTTIQKSKSGKYYLPFKLLTFDKQELDFLCCKEHLFNEIQNKRLVKVTYTKGDMCFVEDIDPVSEKDFAIVIPKIIIDLDAEKNTKLQQYLKFILKKYKKYNAGHKLLIKYKGTWYHPDWGLSEKVINYMKKYQFPIKIVS